MIEELFHSNEDILSVCAELTRGLKLAREERALLHGIAPADSTLVAKVLNLVDQGQDPLGDAFMSVNSAQDRRCSGAVYTPAELVNEMFDWASSKLVPARVVDVGCGSGRFAIAAARRYPDALVVAVDLSPMATLMCKAHAAAAGVEVKVICNDFMSARLPSANGGPTLWVGNPPYVRHHDIDAAHKERFVSDLARLGLGGSALAGLHAHFVVSIAKRYRRGDAGCLLLPSEWMDVCYGQAIRDALTKRLGLSYIHAFDKKAEVFDATASTAVVVGFSSGECGHVLANGSSINLSEFDSSQRWSEVVAGRTQSVPDGYVRLGDFARVHRGVVTGCNKFWVRRPGEVSDALSIPVVAHARELQGDVPVIRDIGRLSRLVTLPESFEELDDSLRDEAKRIVASGKAQGVDEGYVARHRRCWWSVKPPAAPSILMTYMARHAPTFVVNTDGIPMLNVVHGIYPEVELSDRAVTKLVDYLNNCISTEDGRTYAGGLTKFEPREVEQLVVPSPEMLEE